MVNRMTQSSVRPIDPIATRALRHAVLRPHESLDALADHEVPGTFAVGAFAADGALVAAGLIGPDGGPGGWRIRGMATAPPARGCGAGTRVLAALLAHAREQGAERIWCNARLPARTLYERAGFIAVSEVFELPAVGPHVVMELRP